MDTRFTDHGDGTITDIETGLTWLKDANHFKTSMVWDEAIKACVALGDGWRLPEIKELLSLIDYSQYNPALPQGHPFEKVQSAYYWSATTGAGGTHGAWVVYMGFGYVNYGTKAYYDYYVWPVRG